MNAQLRVVSMSKVSFEIKLNAKQDLERRQLKPENEFDSRQLILSGLLFLRENTIQIVRFLVVAVNKLGFIAHDQFFFQTQTTMI